MDSRQSFSDREVVDRKGQSKLNAKAKALKEFIESPAYPIVKEMLNANISPYHIDLSVSDNERRYTLYSTLRDVRDMTWREVESLANKHKGEDDDE